MNTPEPFITAEEARQRLGQYFGTREMSWYSFHRAIQAGMPAHVHPCGGRRKVYYLSELLAWLGDRRNETRLVPMASTRVSSHRKPRKRGNASEAR